MTVLRKTQDPCVSTKVKISVVSNDVKHENLNCTMFRYLSYGVKSLKRTHTSTHPHTHTHTNTARAQLQWGRFDRKKHQTSLLWSWNRDPTFVGDDGHSPPKRGRYFWCFTLSENQPNLSF